MENISELKEATKKACLELIKKIANKEEPEASAYSCRLPELIEAVSNMDDC